MRNKSKIAIIILSVLILVMALNLQWWFCGKLNEFHNWYPNIGFLLWALKSIILLIAFIAATYTLCIFLFKISKWGLSKINLTIPIFIFVAVIALGFKFNTHPFSNFPMYTSFPNWSYVFTLEDMDGNVLPLKEYTNYTEGDISDLYYNYMIQRKVRYGGVESQEIAEQAAKEIINSLVLNRETKGVRLVRLYYRVENKRIVETKEVLYEKPL